MHGPEIIDQSNMSEIDPIQFGALTAKVSALEEDVRELRSDVKKLLAAVENARGGWKTMMILGGLASSVGGAITYYASKFARLLG